VESSKGGETVRPGATIDWTISVSVSAGDNEGLALVCCDLVQEPANPALFDIPPADVGSIDATMQNFSRPDGVSNPPETDPVTGYIGVQRGTAGQMDLVQIGGGQNSFGAALPPGTGIGESADTISYVGQGGSPQIIASGTFTAPAAYGTYVFRVENALANVLDAVNPPPEYSPVSSATADSSAASFSFTVGIPSRTVPAAGLEKKPTGESETEQPEPIPSP